MTNEWTKPERAEAYLARMNDIPHRMEGEATLLAEVPVAARQVLDLGWGNGHLVSLVLTDCPNATGTGVDFLPPMLKQARQRFAADNRVSTDCISGTRRVVDADHRYLRRNLVADLRSVTDSLADRRASVAALPASTGTRKRHLSVTEDSSHAHKAPAMAEVTETARVSSTDGEL